MASVFLSLTKAASDGRRAGQITGSEEIMMKQATRKVRERFAGFAAGLAGIVGIE